MAEEVTEQTQEAVQTETAVTEPTLDDVYREVGEPRQPQAPQQPVAQPQPVQQPAPNVPDPYDTEAHKAYLSSLAQGQTTLQQGLAAVAQFLTTQQRERAESQQKADISKAVETMKEVVPDLDQPVLEAFLDGQARRDPRFKNLWEKRSENPQAWEKAVKAYSRELAGKVSIKVDPKLQEAQRARKLAQGAMATTAAESPDEKWDKVPDAEFGSEWQRLLDGNTN